VKIRLSEKDRERYGAPDALDCSLEDGLSVRDAIALEKATGRRSVELLAEMLPEVDDHPTDDDKVRFRFRPEGILTLVWLGLHRAGIDVPFADLDFDFTDFIAWRPSERPGKGPASNTSGPATPSKSRRSGRSTRSKTSTVST
jgi:hypothetical protein